MARNLLRGVRVLWLQGNKIDTAGLRALARGLLALPADTELTVVSLGGNKFHSKLSAGRAAADACDLRIALSELDAAAEAHRVRVRLFS